MACKGAGIFLRKVALTSSVANDQIRLARCCRLKADDSALDSLAVTSLATLAISACSAQRVISLQPLRYINESMKDVFPSGWLGALGRYALLPLYP